MVRFSFNKVVRDYYKIAMLMLKLDLCDKNNL